jgi:hypothetical protein
MKYRRLSSSGDYLFGGNKQNFVSDLDAVAQAIMTRLKLFLAEWWENTADGLPLWQQIVGTNGKNVSAIDILIRQRIVGTENVTGIASYTSAFDSTTRNYSFVAVVNTSYGQVTVTNSPAMEVT